MQTVTRSSFTSVKTEGGLLPADLLQRIADNADLPGLRPVDYHLYTGERVNEAINRAWNRCAGAWKGFQEQREQLPVTDSGTTLTRERWLLVLLQELGFGRLPALRGGLTAGDTSFPISHLWQNTPIHLVTFRQGLDQRSEAATALKRSPHALMQELLNRSPEYQWGIIANGLSLRILRDNASLRRAAFVEFDLAAIMEYELYAEFALLWMVCHQSRFERLEIERLEIERLEIERLEIGDDENEPSISNLQSPISNDCWLERWSKLAAERGTRAMDALRDGVKEAVIALGTGYLAHRENGALREKLRTGDLRADDYYRQLRRLVYRLIFLAVAEDRDMLLLPETSADSRQLYSDHYSLRRLRTLAATLRGGPHPDLHRQLRMLFVLLRTGYAPLGIPGLGSFLFSDRSTPDLDNLELANQHLLAALRALSFTIEGSVRRPVDFRNLDSEELGSIYQSLLELHPEVNLAAPAFLLNEGAGSERKTTGSHYTPTPLVENLLDTALEPVVAERLESVMRKDVMRKDAMRNALSVTSDESRITDYASPAESAILSIKVLDAACGSGHMLIGAGRRLARHLARIRTREDEPSPGALRAAMRDVVRHCLYGVDLNDMAVELCKVALWMESLEPGKPLSFLDAHIQCGNSLIGVTPGLDISEIPDDAFQPVTGDDKATATGLRRRNKKEREGKQFSLLYDSGAGETPEELERWRAAQMAKLESAAEEAVTQVREKEIAYDAYLGSDQYETAKLQLDLWTAAFFWPIPAGDPDHMLAPTQNALEYVRAGQRLDETLDRQVREIAYRHRFFHWALQYPDVFLRAEGGFNVILMNPPWERIKLQEKEWFAARSPAIASASNAAERKRMIAALQTEDPALWQAFQDDLRGAESESHFIRNSGKYPLCGRGDVNTYAIFAELVRQVLSPAGRVGIIVPTGIATDDTTKFYFQDVTTTRTLASLYSFENEEFIFPSVHHAMKFCLLTLSGVDQQQPSADFFFFARQIDHLKEENRHFVLSADEIALLNPNTGTCPIFRTKRDAELTKAIYRRVPVLINEGPPSVNPWGVSFLRMIDMSNDSHLFRTREQLERDGWRLSGNHFVRGTDVMLPLYEAKMMQQYNHRFGDYADRVEDTGSTALPEIPAARLNDPHYAVLPRYWVRLWDVVERTTQVPKPLLAAYLNGEASAVDDALTFWLASYYANRGKPEQTDALYRRYFRNHDEISDADAVWILLRKESIGDIETEYPLTEQDVHLIAFYEKQGPFAMAKAIIEAKAPGWFVAFRNITNATNERSTIASILPIAGVGHSAPLIRANVSNPLVSKLVACLSSFVLDYTTRQSVGGTNLTYGYLKQLPVLPHEVYSTLCTWDTVARNTTIESWLLPRVLELTYTAWDLQPFARDCGYDGPPFRWDEDRRFLLRCELDAAYFHLYGIERDDVDYIMETFPIVKRKDIARHGEYRTKRVILEMYDDMAAAMQGGAPYVTRLDPPPADARVAHDG